MLRRVYKSEVVVYFHFTDGICFSACTHGNTLGIQKLFSVLREESSLVSCDMIRIILKMMPKMALIDPSPFIAGRPKAALLFCLLLVVLFVFFPGSFHCCCV